MNKVFIYALDAVLKWEGGYSNHKLDPGGATNLGITHKTLARWRGVKRVTRQEVKDLTLKETKVIYYNDYWLIASCNKLPPQLAICVFDCAVNQGPVTAKKILQWVLKVKRDGQIGPKTLKAVNETDEYTLSYSYMARRGIRYSALAIFGIFGYGWFRRLFDVYGKAIKYN